MSAALATPLESRAASVEKNIAPVHVLTLTPFYPSVQDPAQGCFIAEPLPHLGPFNIEAHVMAVHPFYRAAQSSCGERSEWQNYYCLPGNTGLVTSGALLARAVRPRILGLHRTSPISLIHAHAALPCGEAAMLLATELDIPFVVSVHGLDVFAERQAGRWLGRWTKRSSIRVYQRAQRIVCISEKVKQLIPGDLQAKARVVYNGVDSNTFRPSHELVGPPRILSVGNLIPTKGHALLLRAFGRVLHHVPESQLEIIGEGPERSRLAELADSLGISSVVTFRGRQDRGTVAAAMQSCSVFALPSSYEGLGCVYLEAMACGKPAIACIGQGIDEIIQHGENGLLTCPEDEAALHDALLLLLRDEALRRRLGCTARESVLKQHTLQHQAAALAEVYGECAQ